jgi:hypothetical protein
MYFPPSQTPFSAGQAGHPAAVSDNHSPCAMAILCTYAALLQEKPVPKPDQVQAFTGIGQRSGSSDHHQVIATIPVVLQKGA